MTEPKTLSKACEALLPLRAKTIWFTEVTFSAEDCVVNRLIVAMADKKKSMVLVKSCSTAIDF